MTFCLIEPYLQKEGKGEAFRRNYTHPLKNGYEKIELKNWGSISVLTFKETFRNFAWLREWTLALQWVRPRLLLLNVRCDPWKINFTDGWETLDTCQYTNRLTLLQLQLLRRFAWFTWCQTWSGNAFLSILYKKLLQECRRPRFKLESKLACQSTNYFPGSVINHSVDWNFSKLLQLLPKNHQHKQKGLNK